MGCSFSKKEECFICCTIDGKSDYQKQMEMMTNQPRTPYPLVLLSNAFGCNCKGLCAHNKCLYSIYKCPTCRKEVKPNLYVKTRYDYYLGFLLNWIKEDNSRIEKMKWWSVLCIIIICLLLCIIAKFIDKELFESIIPPKSNQSLCFAIVIGTVYVLAIYCIILDDYFKKYWLYDPKLKKCFVFN